MTSTRTLINEQEAKLYPLPLTDPELYPLTEEDLIGDDVVLLPPDVLAAVSDQIQQQEEVPRWDA